MNKRVCLSLVSFFTVAAFLLLIPTPADSPGLLAEQGIRPGSPAGLPSHVNKAAKARIKSSYGKLPLSFEPNQGQASDEVKFLSRGQGYGFFLTGNEAVLSLRGDAKKSRVNRYMGPADLRRNVGRSGHAASSKPAERTAIRMKLAGANPGAQVAGLDELPGKSNYFIGNDPKTWQTNVPNYAKVRYRNVYPGIDLVYYGNQRQLEYDFVVAPGADPKAIALEITGTEGSPQTTLAENGDLVIKAEGGEVRFHKPVVYQAEDSSAKTPSRKPIDGGFVLLAKNRIGFDVSSYDPTKPLIIDPVLSYSTYLGGSESDSLWDIAVDAAGNVYATGETQSMDFPVSNPFQTNFAGGTCTSGSDTFPCPDVFVLKLNAAGDTLVYSTFLGGGDYDAGYGIAVDSAGVAYVTGETWSSDFPLASSSSTYGGSGDIFLTILSAAGSSMIKSRYLGSIMYEAAFDVTVDTGGNAYLAGVEESGNGDLDGFMMAVYASGPVASRHAPIGGSGDDLAAGITLDSAGNIFVTGTTFSSDFPTNSPFQAALGGGTCGTDPPLPCPDAFVIKFLPSGGFTYSTYLGGNGADQGNAIAVDSTGRIYVAGTTWSTNFPTANAFQADLKGDVDAFVTRFNTDGSALDYSTYLGGEGYDYGRNLAVDAVGNAIVVGDTSSQTFPTVNPVQSSLGADLGFNTFVTKFNSAGSSLAFSSYLGATGNGTDYPDDYGYAVALDTAGNIYLAGRTQTSGFPTVNALQPAFGGSGDGFIAKISPVGLGISPTKLDFGSVGIGVTSSAKVVTLSNTGTDSVSILGIAASGDFQETDTCSGAVAGGSSCTISVTFMPTATGTRTGELTVTTSVAGSPPPVSLTGIGVQSTLSISPSSLTFDDQLVGSTSDPQTVTVTNTGTATVNISEVQPSTNFTRTHNCGTSLAAGNSCTINVSFAPTAAGPMTEQITIKHNAAGGEDSVTVSGKGTDFSIQPASGSGAQSATVTAGEKATYNLSIMPAGYSGSVTMGCTWRSPQPRAASCSVSPTTVNLDGTNAANFAVSVTTTARSMAPVGWQPQPPAPHSYPISHLAMWLLGLAAVASLALRRRRVTMTLASALLLVVLWTACGGGSSSPATTSTTVTGTQAGTYSLTVAATSGSVTRSIDPDLTLVVK